MITALLPDLDSRFERFYGYLNDDVTRRRASIGLALQLAGASDLAAEARSRLEASRPLVSRGLVVVEDQDRPLLTRGLRVPDRVVAHLLGDDAPDPALGGLLTETSEIDGPLAEQIAHAMNSGVRLFYLGDRGTGTAPATAVGALSAIGRSAVALDLGRLARSADPSTAARLAVREALLRDAGLVAWPVDQVTDGHPEVIATLAEADAPVLLCGAATWDPLWSARHPVAVEALGPPGGDRTALWRRELTAAGPTASGLDLDRTGRPSRPGPDPDQPRGADGRHHGPTPRRPDRRRRPAPWRTVAERCRPGAARPANRTRGRLGRPGPDARPCDDHWSSSRPGPAIGTRC